MTAGATSRWRRRSPSRADRDRPDAIRAATFTVEAARSAAGHRPRRRRVRRRPVGVGRPRRALDPLRADGLRRAGHRACAGAAARGEPDVAGARELAAGSRERARSARAPCRRRTHGVHAEPTSFGSARRLRLRGRSQRRAARAAFEQAAVVASPAPSARTRRSGRSSRRASSGRLDLRGEQSQPKSSRATASPKCCRRSRGRRRLERLATELGHLQRAEVREVEEPFRAARGASGAMPQRNPITTERMTGLARVLHGYARRASRTSPCGTSATSRAPAPSGSSSPTPRSCSTTCSPLALRVVRGMTVHADRMRPTSS